jgi:hypothetical protein
MAVSLQELSDFNRFAAEKLSNGGAETLQAVLDEWNAQREREESVAGIRQSIAQYEAGQGLPVEQAFLELRNRLD